MEKHQYICPKCGCQQYESDRLQATGGNFAKMFDIQNKKFVTISCCNCGYTELERGGKHPHMQKPPQEVRAAQLPLPGTHCPQDEE